MHEGYALFIDEVRDYTRPIGIAVCSIFTIIGVIYLRNLTHPGFYVLFASVLNSFLINYLYYRQLYS